ncbi:hypothetical protein ACFVTY_26885 [Streptomyces sp. NPDC058067]|uniref:SCO2400 family protein n=1 Tax=Streptomyces sp. NPDC058067 TaxID=3346324 RepID=UPI0036F0ABA0
MDYCHPCRRHLNGALACPGCGTPADACREHAEALAAQDPAEGAGVAYADEPAYPRRSRRERRETVARRAHRRRRNKIVFAAAGLALAAGGLSFAELGTESSADGDGRGSSSSAEEAADREAAAAAFSAAASPTSGATTAPDPHAPTSSASPSPSASESDDVKKADKEKAVAAVDRNPGGATTAPAATPTSGGAPTEDPRRPAPRPATTPPAPVPTPTHTCDRFLWWCT